MAARRAEFSAHISAEDDASKVLDDIADKGDDIERNPIDVKVKGDDVDKLDSKLEGLTDEQHIVALAVRAGAAQSELADLATKLATIDADDPTIDLTVARFGEVSNQLDQLEQKMKDIADTSLDPDVGDKAKSKLAGISSEAGKAQDAVKGMAGSAVGDLAATATGIGPLGEALGQLTETAINAEDGIAGIASAGLGLGALSAGMFVVNKVMGEFAKTAERAAEIKAFDTADVNAFTKALTTGKDVVDDYVDRMTALGQVTTVASTRISDFAGPVLESTKDIAPALAAAGITMRQFAEAVNGSQDDLDRFNEAVKATGVSTDDANLIISGAATEAENLAKAHANAARFTKVFGDNTDHSAKQVDLFNDAAQQMRNKLVGVTDSQKDAAKAAQQHADAIRDTADAAIEVADSSIALMDANRDFADASANTRAVLADQASSVQDVQHAIDAERDSAIEASKAARRYAEEHAPAGNAARTAQAGVDAMNKSLIDSARNATPQAQAAIASYITEIQGIPPTAATEIQALIAQGKYDEALAKLNALSDPQTPTVYPQMDPAALAKLTADLGRATADRTVKITADTTALVSDIGAAIKKASQTLVRVNGGGTG